MYVKGRSDEIVEEGLEQVIKLSRKTVENSHAFTKHFVHKAKEQLGYTSLENLNKKLGKSFFNPDWTWDQVMEALEYCYDRAIREGFTGQVTYNYLGENITVVLNSDKTFKNAWGAWEFTVEEFLKLFGG